MRALVTGSNGFIGSHLAAELVQRGHDVSCLVRRTSRTESLDGLPIRRVIGDTRDRASLDAVVKDTDVVFHLAGVIDAPDPAAYFAVNTQGTRNLIEACLASAPGLWKFVFVSSISAAGPSPCGTALNEDDASRPISDYGRSKLAAEEVVLGAGDRLPVTVIRPPNVLGPGQKELADAIRLIRRRIKPTIGSAEARTSVVSVSDVVRALILAAEDPRSRGRIYYVTDGHAYSWREITDAVAESLGVRRFYLPVPYAFQVAIAAVAEAASRLRGTKPLVSREHIDATRKCWVYDGSRIRRELGFVPETDMPAAVRAAVAWSRESQGVAR
jgi:nucleoside-diphosphate-sugar epimerase